MRKTVVYLMTFIIIVLTAACNYQGALPDSSASPTKAAATASNPGPNLVEGSGDILDPSEYQFAIVYGGVHPYFDPYKPGAKAAAKDLGIPEPYVVSPQAWDQTEQNQVIDGVIARGAKGIGMFPSDAAASNEEITKIVGDGIPVVTIGGKPDEPSDAEFCYATDVYASVERGTQELINKLRANGLTEGHIVHLCSALNDTNTQKRRDAIKNVLSRPENAGFTLYQELADTDNIELAEQAISEMYATYIDEVDGIICTGYVNAQVLAKTMIERGTNDGIVAIGIDDSQDVLNAIDRGYMYGTMTQNPWGMGYVAIYALKWIKDGYTYRNDKPFFIDSGFDLLTKDKLKTYQKDMEDAARAYVLTMKDEYFLPPAK